MSPGTDSKDSIPPAYEAWMGGAVRQPYYAPFRKSIDIYQCFAITYLKIIPHCLAVSIIGINIFTVYCLLGSKPP
jgi:hypothetical protein